jgi:hypothetical protein
LIEKTNSGDGEYVEVRDFTTLDYLMMVEEGEEEEEELVGWLTKCPPASIALQMNDSLMMVHSVNKQPKTKAESSMHGRTITCYNRCVSNDHRLKQRREGEIISVNEDCLLT